MHKQNGGFIVDYGQNLQINKIQSESVKDLSLFVLLFLYCLIENVQTAVSFKTNIPNVVNSDMCFTLENKITSFNKYPDSFSCYALEIVTLQLGIEVGKTSKF